jgi:hypothetical protein
MTIGISCTGNAASLRDIGLMKENTGFALAQMHANIIGAK